MSIIPFVVERDGNRERSYDIYSRLLKERIIFVGEPITGPIANVIVAQLLFLEAQDAEKDINMYISSPGGIISSGLAVYDTMQLIKPPVATYCMGSASSMAAVLLAAGTGGKRNILPNARVMIHQPMGGTQGQASDIEIQAKEILKIRVLLNKILAQHTGQTLKKIEKDTDRNFWMDAQQAVDYGIVDNILSRRTRTEK